MIEEREKNDLLKVFLEMDVNHDGKLSFEELTDGYTKITNNPETSKAIVDSIMREADPDRNGFIEYTEFVMAACNKNALMTEENIKKAFNIFDVVCL